MKRGRPKKARKVYSKSVDLVDELWLKKEPDISEIELTPHGGYHIPIEKLRPLLDRLNYQTKNYHYNIYKFGYDMIQAYGSIELTVTIDKKERTVTGAYNLLVADSPNGFWNGTLKSECIKNAALELGKRLGRELNKDTPKAEPNQVAQTVVDRIKAHPNDKIMKQYQAAVERGDEAAIATLKNIYEIKIQSDAIPTN